VCAVIGYVGKSLCSTFIFEGLARLEYRGYDSAGFACLESTNQKLLYLKSSGQLSHLTERLKKHPIDGFLGMGHTRWSTHGDFSEKNAHPHVDCTGTVSVVHNGIIENYDTLKSELLKAGHVFRSDTDTEVISHFFESLVENPLFLVSAVSAFVQNLHGMYAFVVMAEKLPNMLIVVRKKSPLCIGIGEGEMFVASDILAFAGKTKKVFFLPDESFAFVFQDIIKVYDFSANELQVIPQEMHLLFKRAEKDGYEHFMLKEIYEQKNAITKTVESLQRLDSAVWSQLGISAAKVQRLQHICLLACGTSWHAARIAQFFFESITLMPVSVHLASEFRHMSFFPQENSLYIFISQSGETADTLEALRLVNAYNELSTIVITNVATSTMVREADGFLLTCAGQEVAVASTKAFSTQLAALYWLSYRIAFEKNLIKHSDVRQAEVDLFNVAECLERSLDQYKDSIDQVYAQKYACYNQALFLGRHISYPLAMESALKLKEVGYVFAESYPAGELKHGPLALVDETMPVYIFSHLDPVIYQKLVSNAHEVKARGGKVIVFVYEGQQELRALAETAFVISADMPSLLGPLAMTALMQYFVYAIAKERGCPIDKPRNLAKSVTVE